MAYKKRLLQIAKEDGYLKDHYNDAVDHDHQEDQLDHQQKEKQVVDLRTH
ncbi:hypothetical protein TIFTF001_020735 [Ficus carica]|uniref:Uncharacterized protein n=1 Tax=Ficus carica TaxID=3494 RepID=A0AA88DJN4_FICCA|nr:hypothetical protein TIFTF001_020735 [Ficus carica]